MHVVQKNAAANLQKNTSYNNHSTIKHASETQQ